MHTAAPFAVIAKVKAARKPKEMEVNLVVNCMIKKRRKKKTRREVESWVTHSAANSKWPLPSFYTH